MQQVLRGLGPCIKAQRFGELVNTLQVDEEDLRGIYFRVATMKAEANGKDGKAADRTGEAVGAGVDLGDIFREVFVRAMSSRSSTRLMAVAESV